jgi:excinuclease UvrABC helicase subunit UvrB
MDKTFDELFNEFFKRNNIKPEDKISEDLKKKADKIIDLLTNFNHEAKSDEEQEKYMDEKLGTPDKIEYYNEGNKFFERKTWNTEHGDIIKISFSEDKSLFLPPTEEKPLQEKLDEAVANEEFEKAASIRDEIKKTKKRIKK